MSSKRLRHRWQATSWRCGRIAPRRTAARHRSARKRSPAITARASSADQASLGDQAHTAAIFALAASRRRPLHRSNDISWQIRDWDWGELVVRSVLVRASFRDVRRNATWIRIRTRQVPGTPCGYKAHGQPLGRATPHRSACTRSFNISSGRPEVRLEMLRSGTQFIAPHETRPAKIDGESIQPFFVDRIRNRRRHATPRPDSHARPDRL